MSNQEKRSSELTPFEAALAGLKPRVEGFDRERLIFLAGQAAAVRDHGVQPAGKGTVPFLLGQKSGQSPWAWPTAFFAMTAVAATLLAMLCTRPAAMVATGGPHDAASSVSVKALADSPAGSQPRSESPAPFDQHEEVFADITFSESDSALGAEMRRHGIDFSRPRVTAPDRPIVVAEAPLTYFELLSRLQGQGPAGQGSLKEMMQ